MSLKRDILLRVAVVYFTLFVLATTIIVRVIYLQTKEVDYYQEKAREISLKDITIESNRGDILTHDGRLLSSSIPFYEIRMDTRCPGLEESVFHRKIDSLAYSLSRLFGDKSGSKYKMQILEARAKRNRYHLIKRRVDFAQLKELKNFPIFRRGQFKGGLIVIQENRRIQPHQSLASRTIGYLSKSKRGNIVGIEGAYDHELRGIKGIKLMQRLPGGVWIPINDENEVEPKDGKDVVTTIDVNLQDVAENALLYQLNKHEADHGTAVLMEVKTGDIKAIANLKLQERSGLYAETYNYAIGESTEPGSTFKLPAMMVALEDGYIELDDTIDTGEGKIKFYDKIIRESDNKKFGKISVQQVFELSSNVGMAKIITDHYSGKETKFVERLFAMNLNEKLGVEILGEGKPRINYPGDKLWSGISLPMMSHGYEIRLTPLQILAFYNAVANNGKMVKPRFVKELRYHGQVVKTFGTEVINPSIASRGTIKKARKMLEGVVENGTATNLRDERYKVAGKTGTAQIAMGTGGYKIDSKIKYQASFVGYFPAENPKYSCIVVISSPTTAVYYGNLVAGPVFKEIADKVMATSLDLQEPLINKQFAGNIDAPYTKPGDFNDLQEVLTKLSIPFEKTGNVEGHYVFTRKKDARIACTKYTIHKNLVPNVREMGAKDAAYLLENMGLKVSIKGRGKVVEQSIPPGQRINKGEEITLKMSFI